jgi:hypothetical protein
MATLILLKVLERYQLGQFIPTLASFITLKAFNSTQTITETFLLCNFCILFPYLPSQIIIYSPPLHFPFAFCGEQKHNDSGLMRNTLIFL